MTVHLGTQCSVTDLARHAALLVDAYTEADRAASKAHCPQASTRQRDIWMELLAAQKQAATRPAYDAAGVLFQIDIASEAVAALKDGSALEPRDDLDTAASVLRLVRHFIEIAFPGAENPAGSYFREQ